MVGVITGTADGNIYIWNKELGYEELFKEDEFKLLRQFAVIVGDKILTEQARRAIQGEIPSRYAPDGTLLYKYCPPNHKTYILSRKLGPFCLHGGGTVVFTEGIQEIHDTAIMSVDFVAEVDICALSHRLKSKMYRLAHQALLATIDNADKCDLYSIEAQLCQMDKLQLDSIQDGAMVEWNLAEVAKLGRCGIRWDIDYDIGDWSPDNDRLVYFLRHTVPETINVTYAYKFAVGYFCSSGQDVRVGRLLYDYLFS